MIAGTTTHFFHGTGADRLFPIMRTNVQVRFLYCLFASFLFSDFLPSSLLFDLFFSSQPHFTSTSGGRYDAKGKTLFQLQFLFSLIIIMTPQAYLAGMDTAFTSANICSRLRCSNVEFLIQIFCIYHKRHSTMHVSV